MMTEPRTTPGLCIADIENIEVKIKARQARIDHIEMEIFHMRDKITILKDEVEEYKRMLKEKSHGNKKD